MNNKSVMWKSGILKKDDSLSSQFIHFGKYSGKYKSLFIINYRIYQKIDQN